MKQVNRVGTRVDVPIRLQELATLKNGWLDGEGIAPKRDELSLLLKLFNNYFDFGLPLPYVYPTLTGGIQMEWRYSNYDVSLDVDFNTNSAYFNALNLVTGAEEDYSIEFTTAEGWEAINKSLNEMIL